MAIDPIKLMKLKNAIGGFQARHSKFVSFIQAMSGQCMQEGTIIEVNITTPDGKKCVSNMKVSAEDVEFFSNLH